MSDVAIREAGAPSLYRPIASPAAFVDAHDLFRQMLEQALTPGVDYGTLPGTNRPILLKPGAERLLLAAGLYVGQIEIVEQTVDPHIEFTWQKRRWDEQQRRRVLVEGTSLGYWRVLVRVGVFERATGNRVGEGIASCSSMEDKYVENPRDSEHTGLAMATKRAIVSATQRTLGLSGLFGDEDEETNSLHPANRRNAAAAKPKAKLQAAKPAAATRTEKSEMTQRLEKHLLAIGVEQGQIRPVLLKAIEVCGKSDAPAALLACANRDEVANLLMPPIEVEVEIGEGQQL